MTKEKTLEYFNTILGYAQYWRWAPDIQVVKEIYTERNDAYSVLAPFMYSYLEELIRSMTPEYGHTFEEREGKVGWNLIDLAIKEANNGDAINLLKAIQNEHFSKFDLLEGGKNRNNVDHGVVHPSAWIESDFQKLIKDIAKLSPYNKF